MGRPRLNAKVSVGDTFTRLTVKKVEYIGRYYKATCTCSCGGTTLVRQSCLLNGESKSCGCLAAELASERAKTHGLSGHRLYYVWYGLNRRCSDQSREDYKHYGGRGITVCSRWTFSNPEGFLNFLSDMEDSYSEGLEIDRIDNDGNYYPENCKWSTRTGQVLNRRFSADSIGVPRYLDDGEGCLHLSDMARKHNITPALLSDRLNKMGMDLKDALSLPVKPKSYKLVFSCGEYKLKDVFVHSPNVVALMTKNSLLLPDFLYYVFGDNIQVHGVVNKECIIFKNNQVIQNFQYKIPKINPDFENYKVNT